MTNTHSKHTRRQRFQQHWQRVPRRIRRPVVLVIGMLFVIAAALTGWLPGPGGIPLFLIGIAILSTEFEWAKKLRDYVIDIVHKLGALLRRHKVIGTLCIVVATAMVVTASVFAYRYLHHKR